MGTTRDDIIKEVIEKYKVKEEDIVNKMIEVIHGNEEEINDLSEKESSLLVVDNPSLKNFYSIKLMRIKTELFEDLKFSFLDNVLFDTNSTIRQVLQTSMILPREVSSMGMEYNPLDLLNDFALLLDEETDLTEDNFYQTVLIYMYDLMILSNLDSIKNGFIKVDTDDYNILTDNFNKYLNELLFTLNIIDIHSEKMNQSIGKMKEKSNLAKELFEERKQMEENGEVNSNIVKAYFERVKNNKDLFN